MQIDPPQPGFPLKRWKVALLIVASGIIFYFFSSCQQDFSPSFEISNFAGPVEVQASNTGPWQAAKRGEMITPGHKLRTGSKGDADLRISGQFSLRLKENTELSIEKSKSFDSKKEYHFHLSKGALLGATGKQFDKDTLLKVSTPVSVAAVRGTLFRIVYDPAATRAWAGVLQGNMEFGNKKWLGARKLQLTNLQSAEITARQTPKETQRISQKDWQQMKETYDLIERGAGFETVQQDLSKEAGNLFQYVFDHGTFYMPQFGYAEREFFRDALTQSVFMSVMYDVFPAGSFVGVYFKTRNLDVSRYESLTFQARRMPGEDYPEAFRIELKSKGEAIRAFAPKVFKKDWVAYEFKIEANRTTPIDEITYVFSHDKVGEHKKGALEFREFQLTLKPETAEVSSPEPQKESSASQTVQEKPIVAVP